MLASFRACTSSTPSASTVGSQTTPRARSAPLLFALCSPRLSLPPSFHFVFFFSGACSGWGFTLCFRGEGEIEVKGPGNAVLTAWMWGQVCKMDPFVVEDLYESGVLGESEQYR